ncbi:hypothetical protein BAE44_0025085 [Dichanthelium oligosanthes]|uniref:KIB1-4 beta-propeller domain-containing protein n=1 Tax=Dichanthelium oligosanthes TaxID=888268 RepID=A0A1E5UM06_9POAL|nr:hypothetical protein BAE44_0025085 [Dichanthelium oligosanthes]
MVLKITPDQQPWRLLMVADLSKSFHLVDNGGELMLVHQRRSSYNRRYDVYRVDLDAGILIPVKGFNGRAVFMGMRRSISVSAGVFPSVTADTIYLGRECDGQILGYNIADGSRVPRQCSPMLDGWVCPDSVVDCLCHCIQSNGMRLA